METQFSFRERQMNKQQEKVLVASLCGLVVVAAGAFAVQPAMAAGYQVDQLAQVTGVAHWDNLNVRKWPASYSQKIGAYEPGSHVWVERCIEAQVGADWCLVDGQGVSGWVNSKYLTVVYDWDI
jgi:uncharacterized protein YraI